MTSVSPIAPEAFRPNPRRSPQHAGFDVLELARANDTRIRLGLVPGSLFWTERGGASAVDDALAGAHKVAEKTGRAHALMSTHPGQLFLAPVVMRGADGDVAVGADLAGLAGLTPLGRHGRVHAVVGATSHIDMRDLAATLGRRRS